MPLFCLYIYFELVNIQLFGYYYFEHKLFWAWNKRYVRNPAVTNICGLLSFSLTWLKTALMGDVILSHKSKQFSVTPNMSNIFTITRPEWRLFDRSAVSLQNYLEIWLLTLKMYMFARIKRVITCRTLRFNVKQSRRIISKSIHNPLVPGVR